MKKFHRVANISVVVTRDPAGGPLLTLLGLKKKKKKKGKMGQGFWVAPGGKTKRTDKSQKHSAQRELCEEMALCPPLRTFRRIGTLQGIGPTGGRLWFVYLYVVCLDYRFKDDVRVERKTYDIAQWFNANMLPSPMWSTDKRWLGRLLKGEKLSVEVTFADGSFQKIASCKIKSLGFQDLGF